MTEPGRSRAYAFPALIGLGILNHTVLTGSRVTVSLYALSLGSSTFVVGVLMGLYAFLPMLLAVAAGRLTDRVGLRKPMLVGSCGVAIAAALPCFMSGIAPLFVTTALLGISFMLFQLATQNATGMFGHPSERAKHFAMLALGYSVSGFCGPLVSGLMIDHASFAGTFALLALLPLIPVAVLWWNVLKLPGPRPVAEDSASGGVAVLFRNRHLRRVFIVNALLAVAWDLHSFFIPIYGATIGLSASRIGVILAAFAAATFIVRLFMGWIARRFSEFEVLAAALFVAATAYALFPFVKEVGPLIALSFALGLALGCAQPMVMSLLHSIAPAGRMGEAVGVRMSIINASTFAMPLLFGAVGSTLGLAPVFWSIGAALAGGGFFARRR
ncbi:MAG TPA: MFS transporter [Casimicrobiaceae bacterium]|nr:MFS transporter [Casimicrobiaceae bacterium]